MKQNKSETVADLFVRVCSAGKLEEGKAIQDSARLSVEDLDVRILMRTVVSAGHYETMCWLLDTFPMSRPWERECVSPMLLLEDSMLIGNVQIAQKLAQYFELDKDDVMPEDEDCCRALRIACSGNHLECAHWLVEEFDLTCDDLCEPLEARLAPLCRNGTVDMMSWICDFFKKGLDEYEMDDFLPAFARTCVVYGRLDLVILMYNKFEVGFGYFSENIDYLMRACMFNKQTEIAQWMINTFKLTEEDVFYSISMAESGSCPFPEYDAYDFNRGLVY